MNTVRYPLLNTARTQKGILAMLRGMIDERGHWQQRVQKLVADNTRMIDVISDQRTQIRDLTQRNNSLTQELTGRYGACSTLFTVVYYHA